MHTACRSRGRGSTRAEPASSNGAGYYFRRVMRAAPDREPFGWEVVVPGDAGLTEAGTEITPHAFTGAVLAALDDAGATAAAKARLRSAFRDGLTPDAG
jgi:hypothetical protein